jgi:7,8-dihydropterin-6-yl-methyl-4-(beta-D-ribofuranosyl)aminobenzene 5'-phosphate synthase
MRRGGAILGTWLVVVLAACRSPASGEPAQAEVAVPEPAAPVASTEPGEPVKAGARHRVKALAITVLSTTHAPVGEGEWGFSALVEADGQRILFDTGKAPETVLRNAETLGVDLTTIPVVVLSHHHNDHVGGFLTLRRAVSERAPKALATAHVATGIFEPRRRGRKAIGAAGDEPKGPPRESDELNLMIAARGEFEATGGTFVVHDGPAELVPGVWVTGPVPRVHPERNWSGDRLVKGPEGTWIEDTLPEGQELVIDTDEGLVVLSGCGHAGVVNIVTHARARIREAPLRAAVGGFHLMDATPEQIAWTGDRLREVGLHELLAAHCTGEPAIRHFGAQVVPKGERSLELGVGGRFELP